VKYLYEKSTALHSFPKLKTKKYLKIRRNSSEYYNDLLIFVCGNIQIWDCCRGMLVEDDAQFEVQMHSQMSRILDRHLSTPRAHLADLHVRFRPLLTAESVPVKDDFDTLGERVVFLQGYLKSVLEEPPEVVHSLVVLRKEGLIRELERIAKGAIQVCNFSQFLLQC
jgi:hypothetical protein